MTRAARTTRLALATSALLLAGPGCGSKASATVEGAVAGTRFTASNFWWGGPYIVLTDVEGECKDVAWAEPGPTFASGDEAPVEGDLNAVLITFLDTDVVKGDYAGRVYGSVYDISNSTNPVPIPTSPAWTACQLQQQRDRAAAIS